MENNARERDVEKRLCEERTMPGGQVSYKYEGGKEAMILNGDGEKRIPSSIDDWRDIRNTAT